MLYRYHSDQSIGSSFCYGCHDHLMQRALAPLHAFARFRDNQLIVRCPPDYLLTYLSRPLEARQSIYFLLKPETGQQNLSFLQSHSALSLLEFCHFLLHQQDRRFTTPSIGDQTPDRYLVLSNANCLAFNRVTAQDPVSTASSLALISSQTSHSPLPPPTCVGDLDVPSEWPRRRRCRPRSFPTHLHANPPNALPTSRPFPICIFYLYKHKQIQSATTDNRRILGNHGRNSP